MFVSSSKCHEAWKVFEYMERIIIKIAMIAKTFLLQGAR
jgi:hypothetical protein